LRATAPRPASTRKRAAIIALAVLLFVLAFSARLAVRDPNALLANFYVVPIAVLAIEFGMRAGLIAAAVAFALIPAWSAINACAEASRAARGHCAPPGTRRLVRRRDGSPARGCSLTV
jgi:hypothetical protein